MKKFTIILFIVALAIAGVFLWQNFKHPSDDQVRQMLVGTWVLDLGHDVRSTTAIGLDGSYECQVTGFTNGRIVRLVGTLVPKDGFLIDTVTSDSQTNATLPRVMQARIVRIDKQELVARWNFMAANSISRKVAP